MHGTVLFERPSAARQLAGSQRRPRPLRRRRDHGTVRATERDLYLLRWVAEQYAVRVDLLRQLVGAYRGAPVSESAIKWLVARWERAGWVKRQKLLAGQPQWVWLSRRGVRELAVPFPYLKPGVGRLEHIHHAGRVRAFVERKRPEARWVSERHANIARRKRRAHRVDGEVRLGDARIAIEVELSQKSRRRLRAILTELQRDYDTAWYFVSPSAEGPVRRAMGRIAGGRDSFAVYRLEDFTERPL